MAERPGLVALFGSGETSASGRKVHDCLLGRRPRLARTDRGPGLAGDRYPHWPQPGTVVREARMRDSQLCPPAWASRCRS